MSKVRSARKRQRQIVRRPTKMVPASTAGPKSRGTLLREAPAWPLHECLLSRDWQKSGAITQALVARRSPDGPIAAALFLIDLGCLGIKNGFTRLCSSEEYHQLRQEVQARQEMGRVELNLVAKVIQEASDYAERLGFAPHPDARRGMTLLAGADPAACDTPIPLGDGQGKPLFIAGPYDNVQAIMAKLERAVGRDGFAGLVPLSGDEELYFDEEE